MRRAALVLALAGFALPALVGCGQATPPLKLSCTTHRLSPRRIRVRVTITNTTAKTRKAIIYGPVLGQLKHIFPVLTPTQVIVVRNGQRQSYFGYVVPRVTPKKPVYLLLRFAPPSQPRLLDVTDRPVVHAQGSSAPDSHCTIGGKP